MIENVEQIGGAARARMLDDIRVAVTFLSRLPLPGRDTHPAIRAAALRFAPLVGVIVAVIQSVVLAIGFGTQCPGLATATLAVLAGILVTGGLHEDGLADVADGLGGTNRERRLAIMRDSRIGSYGALALGVSLLLRVAAVAALLDRSGPLAAGAALLVSAPLSRALMLVPMAALPPARPDGLARAMGALPVWSVLHAFVLAGLIGGIAIGLSPLGVGRAITSVALAAALCLVVTAWAQRALGGVTGDLIGACQQLTEIALILVLSSGGPLA